MLGFDSSSLVRAWIFLRPIIYFFKLVAVNASNCHLSEVLFQKQMRFLFMCGMSERVEALAFKVWRDNIRHLIQTADFKYNGDNSVILHSTLIKLAHFEDELPKLKEATTILELALWKVRMNENIFQQKTIHNQKKIKADESCIRSRNRVACGADVVIGNVLLGRS